LQASKRPSKKSTLSFSFKSFESKAAKRDVPVPVIPGCSDDFSFNKYAHRYNTFFSKPLSGIFVIISETNCALLKNSVREHCPEIAATR